MELERLQEENKNIVKHLKRNGIKAEAGDDDFSTVMTWDDIGKVRQALDKYGKKLVIRESFGYDGCHIIYPAE